MGNKDPAFLFYPSDFLTGVMLMTDDQVGKYIKLLCLQHQKGHLSDKHMLQICQTYDEDIFSKFSTDEQGLYFNERLDAEIQKRRNYSESRSKNRLSKKDEKDMSDICQSYEEHMVNENVNTNITKKDIVTKHKYGSYENVLLSDEDYEKLMNEFPDYKKRIEELSEGIASKGYKYKNHLATIRSWARREKEKPSGNPFKDKLKEMIGNEQSRDNSNHVGYQGGLSKLLQEPDRD